MVKLKHQAEEKETVAIEWTEGRVGYFQRQELQQGGV